MTPIGKLFLAVAILAAGGGLSAQAAEKAAIFAGGCFWCVESDFDKVPGVISTTSGYIGGSAQTANYKTVSSGGTGHYEAVRIVYDPAKVSYRKLVDIFWRTVDPTDPGGQFCDRGSSYKTAIFVTSEEEKKIAYASKLKAQEKLGREIVTKILDAGPFYDAEGYHQDYYKKNPVRYKIYRYGCGRDSRIGNLWGPQAHMGLKE
jgi:peptide-methionine (S)-S-oxide reductase